MHLGWAARRKAAGFPDIKRHSRSSRDYEPLRTVCRPGAMNVHELLSLPVEELVQRARVGCRLFPSISAMMEHFAWAMADEIRRHNELGEPTRWILPVGPTEQYPRLVEICNREQIRWRNVFTFQMDDFLDWEGRPLALDHPFSFEGYMRREVFGKLEPELRPPPENVYFPSPYHPDRISERIRAVGGIDTCYGGIGYHGHVAFNEPPISRWHKISVEQLRQSRTRMVALGDDSIVIQSIQCSGGSAALIPRFRV
jgi:glucosamine-6-phosphate deaminase